MIQKEKIYIAQYYVGNKIKIRDDITYYDAKIPKDLFANLYNRTLTVCSVNDYIDNDSIYAEKIKTDIRVKEDNRWIFKPEWIEHIEENSNSQPHLIAISFEPDRVVGEVYVNCHINNTVELNYPEYNNNESTASIAHKVINELFKGIEE